MRLFIVAVDDPIYLNPYVRAVIERCPGEVAGVAVFRPRRRHRSIRRTFALALLASLVLAPRDWLRLLALKLREGAARLGLASTRHTLADICRQLAVPTMTIASANTPEFVQALRTHQADVVLNQTPEILKGDVLTATRYGVINRHMAYLPAYRGAWPVFWQFARGEPRFGITIHRVDDGIDTGAIIVREEVDRLPDDTIASAYRRLFARSPDLTREALTRLQRGAPALLNDGAAASYFKTPEIGDVLRFMIGGVRPTLRSPA